MANKKGLVLVDTKVTTILAKLEKEQAKLKKLESTPWRTGALGGTFEGISIKDEILIDNLIRLSSIVMMKHEAYDRAAETKLMKTNYPPFTIASGNGGGRFSEEDIQADIKLKYDILEVKEKSDKLESFRTKTQSLMTEEEKKGLLIKEIEEYFENMELGDEIE